ncbi:unnamed protein product [Owenia fusiformis]|uniref:Nuclear pore complex protein Nup155 n=1 Tax=Owenia fusiformis TaxID=6347 RepID=A0A8J1UWR6_OWEFU|nr:unnamed protein product [Owenia fusiformis]
MSSFMGPHMTLPHTAAQGALETAALLVDKHLVADSNYLDLSELLKVPSHSQPSTSGQQDFDYPQLADPRLELGSVPELTNLKKVPLPPELVEQYGHMQCNCRMGLFPEISRAWLTIDSDIFVWNYEDGQDLAYFDGLNETILSAGLVKPKPGIFQPHILYLLCLCTPVDIVLLGVSFTKPFESKTADPGNGEMHLLPDPLFSIPTDNTHIVSIQGAASGRIFMAGKDGCLYELYYQADDGWFSKKCRKINHSKGALSYIIPQFLNFSFSDEDPVVQISVDNSRNILYTRSEKGTIMLYDLGADGKGMNRVAGLAQNSISHLAALTARTDRSNFKQIVHIAALSQSESRNIHLVAVTQTGVRLYFTTNPFGQGNNRPYMLQMVHVRHPPGFSASGAPMRPSNVHMAHYDRGMLVLACAQNEEGNVRDVVWGISADSFPFQQQLMETSTTLPIESHTWAVTESVIPQVHERLDPGQSPSPKAEPPLVVTQHMETMRRIVLLSSQGSHLVTKLRPVDQLREILIKSRGPDTEEVRAFFQLHKEAQACATCLILACSKAAVDQEIAEWATRAFFLYGGEPIYNMGTSGPMQASTLGPAGLHNTTFGATPHPGHMPHGGKVYSPSVSTFATPGPGVPNQMSTPNPNYLPPQQQQQQQQQQNQTFPPNVNLFGQEVTYSGKHNGICQYLARILRPIWEHKIVQDFSVTKPSEQYTVVGSTLSGEEVSWFLEQLIGLKDFIQLNSKFSSPLAIDSLSMSYSSTTLQRSMLSGRADQQMEDQLRRRYQAEATGQEKFSLQQIQDLIMKTCEVLGLWKILCEHQFHLLAASLTEDQRKQLRSMTFKQMVVSGTEITAAMITCLVNRYLGDNATTDAISSRLREVAPSLYSVEDATCSKAHELVQSAKLLQNKYDKDKVLKESLQLYKEVALQLDLQVVCQQYVQIRYYDAIVDLCITAANKRDPQNLALHYYRNGEPPEDTQGMQAFIIRRESYRFITELLGYFLNTSAAHPYASNVPVTPGPPPLPDPNMLSAVEAEKFTEDVLRMILKSTDEMLHVALYDWLINMELSEKLLEIQSPFLEPYLKRAATIEQDNLDTLDLLWKYYEKTKDYASAAKILSKLADRQCIDINLQQRLEYLSRAAMSAKSSTLRTTSSTQGEFLHELEEKMEVARIQLQIFDALSRRGDANKIQDTLSRLNSELLDITTLYGEFADPFDLSESKLAIILCAGHHDPSLVDALWQDIIEKELELTIGSPVNTRMATLGRKIISLGKIYAATERYFPVPFLVKYLERKSCEGGFDQKWVFTIMQDVGIPLTKLQEIYDRMFKSKDPCWQAAKKPLHLMGVIYHLLASFTEAPAVVPSYERRQFTTICLDTLASYLVELHAMSSTDPTVRKYTTDFKGLQAKLERLL